jgi:hypothetical protein
LADGVHIFLIRKALRLGKRALGREARLISLGDKRDRYRFQRSCG